MRKFIFKISLFLLPIIIFMILMELLLRNIPNEYSYKKQYLDKNSKKITKLFLGSSHSYFGINPKYISSKSFNAANVSQSIDLDYKIINKYKDSWDSLQYLIIPIDYFSLFSRLSEGKEKWRIKNYNLYFDLNLTNKLSNHSELLSINTISNIKRIVSYYILRKHNKRFNKYGFGITYTKHRNLTKTGKKAAFRHTKSDLSELLDNIKIVNNIIKFAKKRNIVIIFYTSPAYKTYVSNLNKKQLDITINTMIEIVNNNKNCYYYNLLENKDFNANDFYDADHLINPNGAKKLTIKLDSIIKNTNAQQKI